MRSRLSGGLAVVAFAMAVSSASSSARAAVTVTSMSFLPETIAGSGGTVFGTSAGDIKQWTSSAGATTIA